MAQAAVRDKCDALTRAQRGPPAVERERAYTRTAMRAYTILLALALSTACQTGDTNDSQSGEGAEEESSQTDDTESEGGEETETGEPPVPTCSSSEDAAACAAASAKQPEGRSCSWLEPLRVSDPCADEPEPVEPSCILATYVGDGCEVHCEDGTVLNHSGGGASYVLTDRPGCGSQAAGGWNSGPPPVWTEAQVACACDFF